MQHAVSFNRVEVLNRRCTAEKFNSKNDQSPRSVVEDILSYYYEDKFSIDVDDKEVYEIDKFEAERSGKRRSMRQFHKSGLYRDWILWQEKVKHVDETDDYTFFGTRRPSHIPKLSMEAMREAGRHAELLRHDDEWGDVAVTHKNLFEKVLDDDIREPYPEMEKIRANNEMHHHHHHHHEQTLRHHTVDDTTMPETIFDGVKQLSPIYKVAMDRIKEDDKRRGRRRRHHRHRSE